MSWDIRIPGAGLTGAEVEISRGIRQDVNVELLQARFHAEGEAVTAMLPGNIVVILIGVVVKLIGSIAGDGCPIRIIVIENWESRVGDALQPKFAGVVSSVTSDAAELLAITAAEAGIEVVQKVGPEDVVVTEAHVVRSLIGRAGIQGSPVNDVSGGAPIVVVAAVDFLLRPDVLVNANFVHIGIRYIQRRLREILVGRCRVSGR